MDAADGTYLAVFVAMEKKFSPIGSKSLIYLLYFLPPTLKFFLNFPLVFGKVRIRIREANYCIYGSGRIRNTDVLSTH